MHCLGAITDERCEVVNVEGIACLGHEPHPSPESGVYQMLAYRADGQQHGYRGAMISPGSIAHDQDVRSPPGGPLRGAAKRRERGLEPCRTPGRIPDRVEGHRRKSGDVSERGHLLGHHYGMLQPQHSGV
jgi:hypothetical protein